MFGLGWAEVAVILLVLVLIFGPKKIPEIGSSLGKTLNAFKGEISGRETETEEEES